jgi:hypothetical protein
MRRAIQRPLIPVLAVLALGVRLLSFLSRLGAGRSRKFYAPPDWFYAPPDWSAPASGATVLPKAVETTSGATVATDRSDYYPGENVVITGSGWQAGEVVTLVLHETPTIDGDFTYYATADASGGISNNEFFTDSHDVGVTFTLTATGANSGLTA